jgi:hypothetical protein
MLVMPLVSLHMHLRLHCVLNDASCVMTTRWWYAFYEYLKDEQCNRTHKLVRRKVWIISCVLASISQKRKLTPKSKQQSSKKVSGSMHHLVMKIDYPVGTAWSSLQRKTTSSDSWLNKAMHLSILVQGNTRGRLTELLIINLTIIYRWRCLVTLIRRLPARMVPHPSQSVILSVLRTE